MTQLLLIAGYYLCQDCERLVDEVAKVFRFWICPDCMKNVVPAAAYAITEQERERIAAYHGWRWEMERKYPLPKPVGSKVIKRPMAIYSDDHYPFCECGRQRMISPLARQRDLFSGPFKRYCSICDGKRSVESVYRLRAGMPQRDDEDWLDLLEKTFPELFDLKVLPDYWFELRQNAKETC